MRVVGWPALADGPPLPYRLAGRQHAVAVGQALLVTFLWSTSWVLIKVGLDELDLRPLGFAGLRYGLAALILLPWAVVALRRSRDGLRPTASRFLAVAAYGIVFVTVAQGAQFAALAVMPATAVNLVLSTIPAAVAAISVVRRDESPSALQLLGVGLLLAGALLYFGPLRIEGDARHGIGAALVCVAASAAAAHLGRGLARRATAFGGALGLTAISMAVGGAALLGIGFAVEGVPGLDVRGWAVVGWLAAVNTALAFTLWNHTLSTLSAVESSVVNNTMTIQIAILAVVFLGERLGAAQVAGLGCAALGALVVQLAPRVARRWTQPPAEERLGEPMR
jgi:drug/metabolite transporter (DMT)-like permease